MKRNPVLIYLVKKIPNKPNFLSFIFKKNFQNNLDNLLKNSMETFNYIGFKLALYFGANPNIDAKIKVGYHLVTRCARSGEDLFLDTLLKFGGDVHANLSKGGYFPIHMAATKGMEKSIEILVKHHADINAVYELENFEKQSNYPTGWTPLICACIHNKTLAGKTLLDLGANPFDINERGLTAVEICLKNNNKELANYILKKQKAPISQG